MPKPVQSILLPHFIFTKIISLAVVSSFVDGRFKTLEDLQKKRKGREKNFWEEENGSQVRKFNTYIYT